MKISVLHRGRLFFSLGNLFFPIYYYIFVIVNYGKDIRLRRIGLGNSSNLMKYRDKLFSPMAGHAFMVCLARWIAKEEKHSKPVIRSFIASYGAISFLSFHYVSADVGIFYLRFRPIQFFSNTSTLSNRDINKVCFATSLSCNMMSLLFRKRCISNICPVIILA